MNRRHLSLAALFLCAGSTAALLAAETKPAETKPAASAPAIDRSSPKAAMKTYFALALAGNFDEMQKSFVTPKTQEEKDLLAYGLSDDMYIPALFTALAEKFPADVGSKIPDPARFSGQLNAMVDSLEESTDGNTGTIKPPANPRGGAPTPLPLTKVGEEWKFNVVKSNMLRETAPADRPRVEAMHKLYKDAIADVKAGKYATMDEMRADVDKKRADIFTKFAPTTAPSTAPAPQ